MILFNTFFQNSYKELVLIKKSDNLVIVDSCEIDISLLDNGCSIDNSEIDTDYILGDIIKKDDIVYISLIIPYSKNIEDSFDFNNLEIDKEYVFNSLQLDTST